MSMNTASATQNQQSKAPFYLSEQNQDKPTGYLFLDNDVLVLEFHEPHPAIKIKQTMALTAIEFVDDSSFRVQLPENPTKKVHLFLRSNGEGRFIVYGIREWTGIDGTEMRAIRKRAYLARFESIGAKMVTFWQLVLPYVLFGITFLLYNFVTESMPEIDTFVAKWQWLVFSPYIVVHYAFLLVPAIAILLYNRLWGLYLMFQMRIKY